MGETVVFLQRLGALAAESRAAKPINEDFCGVYRGSFVSALAVADGIGSSTDSHIAAAQAVQGFLEPVTAFDTSEALLSIENVATLWDQAGRRIKAYYAQNERHYATAINPLQTTLLTVVETKNTYIVSYLGNGSVWLIRGDFWKIKTRPWPWCVSDLMLTHSTVLENGREALFGAIGPDGVEGEPRYVVLNKDTQLGELVLLTTDGISSPDQLKFATDEFGKLWIEANPHINKLLHTHLRLFLAQMTKECASARADDLLAQQLASFLQGSEFEDDATIGMLVSPTAIANYQEVETGLCHEEQ